MDKSRECPEKAGSQHENRNHRAGSMGRALADHLAKLGHRVSIANSRGPASLSALAAEVGATPVSVPDAATAGEIVILAIPTKAVADLPRGLFANFPSTLSRRQAAGSFGQGSYESFNQ